MKSWQGWSWQVAHPFPEHFLVYPRPEGRSRRNKAKAFLNMWCEADTVARFHLGLIQPPTSMVTACPCSSEMVLLALTTLSKQNSGRGSSLAKNLSKDHVALRFRHREYRGGWCLVSFSSFPIVVEHGLSCKRCIQTLWYPGASETA